MIATAAGNAQSGRPTTIVAAHTVSATTAVDAAQSATRHAALPLRREPLPARSTEQAEKLGIRRLVAAFTTRHPCCQPRVDNIHRIAQLLDGLLVAGGDGTFAALRQISSAYPGSIRMVGVPKTIDNDLAGTEVTFGFDTACSVITEAVDALAYLQQQMATPPRWLPKLPLASDGYISDTFAKQEGK